MDIKFNNRVNLFVIAILTGAVIQFSISPVIADELDDLLNPNRSDLVKNDASARLAWEGVVDSFRKSDFEEARRRGDAFLEASFEATPYQLLGVQTLISLSGGEDHARTVLDKDATGDINKDCVFSLALIVAFTSFENVDAENYTSQY